MPILTGGLTLHWFGVLVALGIVIGRLLVGLGARVYAPGDPDRAVGAYTACVVGGIVGAHVGIQGLPHHWHATREPLPDWADVVRAPAGRTDDQ